MELPTDRLHLEAPAKRIEQRNSFQVDRDRVLYAREFSRLAEVTQVISADHGYVFHNRLTHSLKVSQLARRIAESLLERQPDLAKDLGGIDPDAAEAAGLAHDLGHPPFGHIAEKELNTRGGRFVRDGFEGNAQSFRIVTKLAVGDPVFKGNFHSLPCGLNLTRRTLNGLLKYPWLWDGADAKKSKKWGAYSTERQEFFWARTGTPSHLYEAKSLEAEIMDWADDITYAVHDLCDFYVAGRIPLDRLANPDDPERANFYSSVLARKGPLVDNDLLVKILDQLNLDERYQDTYRQRSDLWRFASILITRYVDAIKIKRPDPEKLDDSLVDIAPFARAETDVLKQLIWHYVILRSELAVPQSGQRRIIGTVFSAMWKAADLKESPEFKMFPLAFQQELRKQPSVETRARIVLDYVSSMTEREIRKIYVMLCGCDRL